jgi:CubicO group peptidase (beta-lactamase class C family)
VVVKGSQAAALRRHAGRVRAPGLQYVVVDRAGIVCEHQQGWADVAAGRAMRADTTMMAYSMSKTITAVAVLQLVESGRLGLEDHLAQHVPDQPYGPAVTIRQLLSHTAGLPNPIPLRWVHAREGHATFDERAALAAVLRAHPRLAHRPGARYAYSNIGYWLLGRVLEEVTGRPFTDYVAEHVLARLDLPAAELSYAIAAGERHAGGYLDRWSLFNLLKRWLIDRALVGERSGRWQRIGDHYPNGTAFGGLVGTARAFGRFLQDQLGARSALLGDAGRARLAEPQRTNDGRTVPMGLGGHLGARGGSRYWFKEGGGGGFHCLMRLYPEAGIGTVVMANATGCDVTALLAALDPWFLGSRVAA